MKYFVLIFTLALSLLFEPAITAKPQLIIAAAANVQYAMNELKSEFAKETGINISVIIGSSGQLTAQIKAGAPYDIFISADMKYPLSLYKSKIAIDTPKIYASGSLVIWSMKNGTSFDNKLQILLTKKILKIALANPVTAPYGAASVQTLKYYGIYDKVKDKLVYGESIAPTNQFIYSKAADAGFTAKSVVMSPQMKNKGKWMEIPQTAYKSINQGCVILKYGYENHRIESLKLFKFLFSGKAKNILSKYGYIVS